MKTTPTPEMIAKLPKWAQEYIVDLSRQREAAVGSLNRAIDTQTPSKIFWQQHECLGEKPGPSQKVVYVQTDYINVLHLGVKLSIGCRNEGIKLQWSDDKRLMDEVAFIPESFQTARLVNRSNMRL